MRLFLAFALPEDVRAALVDLQERARGLRFEGRWPPSDTFHVTLHFLGERSPEEVATIERLAAACAARTPALTLRTGGVGGFPTARRARMAWLALESHPALEALAHDLQRAFADSDSRPFVPHLTWARLRRPTDVTVVPPPPPLTFRVETLTLFQSHLGPRGPRHEVICGVPLGGGEG